MSTHAVDVATFDEETRLCERARSAADALETDLTAKILSDAISKDDLVALLRGLADHLAFPEKDPGVTAMSVVGRNSARVAVVWDIPLRRVVVDPWTAWSLARTLIEAAVVAEGDARFVRWARDRVGLGDAAIGIALADMRRDRAPEYVVDAERMAAKVIEEQGIESVSAAFVAGAAWRDHEHRVLGSSVTAAIDWQAEHPDVAARGSAFVAGVRWAEEQRRRQDEQTEKVAGDYADGGQP